MPVPLIQLALVSAGPGTCHTCDALVPVKLVVREEIADYSGDTITRSGHVRAEFQHTCPGPKRQT